MSKIVLERLQERFTDAILAMHSQHGDDTAVVRRERVIEILSFLKTDPEMAFNMGSDLTVVDHYGQTPRFMVVYHLYSIGRKHRVRIKTPVPEEDPVVDSSVALWSGFNWFEREAWDMYGIKFRGHPDLRRMFMWETFVGHPLRKDYPKDKRQPLIRREDLS